ncbi:bifunctional peptidase and (3S)-lysyl hydroxylase Jmjd7-like [Watersipora subatra]|uniref:bifunctional peptidase and (3S)-lysyl hydroxylase Jmjd7-like n=1 Tax=Watersipora subatra TaxID=2589382 RepID=UPI00355B0F7B
MAFSECKQRIIEHKQTAESLVSVVDFLGWVGLRVDFVDTLTPLSFYREYVAPNLPLKVLNGFNHWPALRLWNDRSLQRILGDKLLTVAVTPDGYADAITDGVFMLPDEHQMTFSAFLEHMNTGKGNVCYIQKQNSNLTTELSALYSHVDSDISWATDAFGTLPDAINFWMGDHRSITSMHHDHYENIYCVVRGSKTFTLIPPTDQCFIPYKNVSVLRYKQLADGVFTKVKDKAYDSLPWIAVNPLDPDLRTYPEFAKAHVYKVTVNEGEMLYLPSLWYHHVTQTDGCVAVNYWYDMRYDIKYNYHQLVSKLLETRQPRTDDLDTKEESV